MWHQQVCGVLPLHSAELGLARLLLCSLSGEGSSRSFSLETLGEAEQERRKYGRLSVKAETLNRDIPTENLKIAG